MLPFFVFIFGLCVGSFLNVVICRLPEGKSIAKGRSKCPDCKHTLGFFDLIPLISFLALRGRCRYCHKHISYQYPIIELITAILFTLAFISTPFSQFYLLPPISYLLLKFFFIAILIITFVTDLRQNLIYDMVLIPGIILALFSPLFHYLSPNIILSQYQNILISGLLGAGVFALQYFISKGRWIGSGDIFLGGFLGLILGWPKILIALYLAYVSGALVALFLMGVGKKKLGDTLPLGCFLAGAGILLLLIT